MSLYKSKVSGPNFDGITPVGNRPKWLNISLAVLTIYTLVCLVMSVIDNQELRSSQREFIIKMQSINEPIRLINPKVFDELNKTVEQSEARLIKNLNSDLVGYAVLIALTVASGVYFTWSKSAIGLFIGGVWTVGLFVMIAINLEFDVGLFYVFWFVRSYGPEMWFHTMESVLQIGFAMWIYFYSALKFKAGFRKDV